MKLSTLLFISAISINSWGAKVLQIGNSHTVGPFGESLYSNLTDNSNVTSVHSVGLVGASGSHYAAESESKRKLNWGYIDRPKMKTPAASGTLDKLSTSLNNEKPDVLIVELGDNFAGYKNNAKDTSSVTAQVQLILKQIELSKVKPKECYWIGPNWTDKENGKTYNKTNARAQAVADAIANSLAGKCNFIDSMKIVQKSEAMTGPDGLHFNSNNAGTAAGKLWGRRSYEAIVAKSTLLGHKKSETKKNNPAGFNN